MSGARLPRPRARGGGLQADPVLRHRRAVRRQVLLPRRPRRPAAPPRRVVPRRDRGLVLGRPAGARQDHRRGRLPRAARDRPGAVPARHRRSTSPGRRGRAIDLNRRWRDPRRAVEAPGEDAAVADRPAGRGPRHRARQDQGAPRRRRGDAAVPARPPGLLRRSGQDARGHGVRLVRPDHGRPDGLLRRAVPGRRRLDGDAGQGQPVEAGHRGVRRARRLLPRLDRRPGRPPRPGLHQVVEVLEYEELGMEAVWKIEVEDFPAFIVVDDKGNDFFTDPSGAVTCRRSRTPRRGPRSARPSG
jgi:hypothetical protein